MTTPRVIRRRPITPPPAMAADAQGRGRGRPAPPARRIFEKLFFAAGRRAGPYETRILPYRGYGSDREAFLMGRVFNQKTRSSEGADTVKDSLGAIVARILRRGQPDVRVKASFFGAEQVVTTDKHGYFRCLISLPEPLQPRDDVLWYTVTLSLPDSDDSEATPAEVLIPPKRARTVIISDIDDTVIFTGVANKLKMVYRLFVQGARSRVPFPGVAALYRALHRGETGRELSPMLYVSRGPWGIYEIIDEFFDIHDIPIGPVLFLREWGVSWRHPLSLKSEGHKDRLIRTMLNLYRDLDCVLIGDSGQHDPEIYARIISDYPGRIKAVYIRNVSRSAGRVEAIKALAVEVASQGSSLVLARDSFAMARHMADQGLISPDGLRGVLREREQQTKERSPDDLRRVTGPDDERTRQAVARGELDSALRRTGKDGDRPGNVVVESTGPGGHGPDHQ